MINTANSCLANQNVFVRRYVQPQTQGIATSIDDIRKSGEQLFASHSNPAFTVMEYDSNVGAGTYFKHER
jgi:hypothetical protein